MFPQVAVSEWATASVGSFRTSRTARLTRRHATHTLETKDMRIFNAAARLSTLALAAGLSLVACGGGDGGGTGSTTTVTTVAPVTGFKTITINSTTDPAAPSENPTFGGTTFGPVGAYRKIIGTATGTLDPADPHNAVITDIQLAPKNADGLVEYSMDFYILTPVDPSKGNHKVFIEPTNRGT
jgi:ABC-type glycerol-3-phosphate transport system substrate-binding protein